MFDDITYSSILQEMLDNVSTDIDKREGSVIWDTLSPVAIELLTLYAEIDNVINESFADTASREYLIKIASERGLEPKEASNAVMIGVATPTDVDISIGTRFNLDKYNYVITGPYINDDENVVQGTYVLQAEDSGREPSYFTGDAIPIDNIHGLSKFTITKCISVGENEESTDDFRNRFFESVNNPAYQGNKAQYKQWVKAIDGVGQCKIIRAVDGGGTVGVVITSDENGEASTELVKSVKEILDPVKTEGQGDGLAPIGHVVSVNSVNLKGVTINIDWLLQNGADEATVTIKANDIIKNYIEEVNTKWEDNTNLNISSYQLIARLAEVTEIQDIASITFNSNETRTLETGSDEIFSFETLVIKGA